MHALFPRILASLLSITLGGCAAIGARSGKNAVQPYAGIKEDVYYLSNPREADQPGLQFLNLVDLPFSFVADTLLLPFEIGQEEKTEKLSENEK